MIALALIPLIIFLIMASWMRHSNAYPLEAWGMQTWIMTIITCFFPPIVFIDWLIKERKL